MIKLSTTPLKRYYFVKNGVVFEIRSVYNGTDECAILCGPNNKTSYLPSLTVTENSIQTIYYLDNLIQDGDTYDKDKEGEKFSKTIHQDSGEEATETFANYYKILCEARIEEAILNYNQDYKWFVRNMNKLGIPNYMFKTDGITVASNEGNFEPIEFTSEYFEEKKVDAVKNASLNAANSVANKYQYRVNEEKFEIESTQDPYNGYEYIEVGGKKWATMNVGANSVTDYGKYFQWGDIKGYTGSQVGSGNGQKYFDWTDYKYCNGTSSVMTKYNTTDGKVTLDIEDDPVRANMGGLWRTPTIEEWQSLVNTLTVKYWEDNYQGSGISGFVCTLPFGSKIKLFFPAAGVCSRGDINGVSRYGSYGCSSISNDDTILDKIMSFNSESDTLSEGTDTRCRGCVFRGVID